MNNQPIEKRDPDPNSLVVHSIFKTIQGEGPFCGTPCVFVRLAGCNLQCPACDTEYTSKRTAMTPCEVLFEVNLRWRADGWRRGLVVITGGEPFRQDLRGLLDALTSAGYYVQIETNGTLPTSEWAYTPDPYARGPVHLGRERVYVVCSPKTPKLHPSVLDVACCLKYVVERDHVAPDGLPTSALMMPNPPARPPEGWDRPVYVQPLDQHDPELNRLHANEAVASCLRHGYTLQVQVHKMVGVE